MNRAEWKAEAEYNKLAFLATALKLHGKIWISRGEDMQVIDGTDLSYGLMRAVKLLDEAELSAGE